MLGALFGHLCDLDDRTPAAQRHRVNRSREAVLVAVWLARQEQVGRPPRCIDQQLVGRRREPVADDVDDRGPMRAHLVVHGQERDRGQRERVAGRDLDVVDLSILEVGAVGAALVEEPEQVCPPLEQAVGGGEAAARQGDVAAPGRSHGEPLDVARQVELQRAVELA
ncbi:MAG: hypothetical protein ABIY55_09875 [Kofleriaceae bacterium]